MSVSQSGSRSVLTADYDKASNVTAVTEVQSTSFRLGLHAQHVFANSVNFLSIWGLSVTIFHSTCILCVYGMALYRPTLLFYLCMYVSFVGTWQPWWVLLQHSIMLWRLFFIIECGTFSAHFLCTMHVFDVWASSSPLGYLYAKFCLFATSTAEKNCVLINHSARLFDTLGTEACASEIQCEISQQYTAFCPSYYWWPTDSIHLYLCLLWLFMLSGVSLDEVCLHAHYTATATKLTVTSYKANLNV